MDKLDEILRQLASGEITPDQAKKVIKPKRGRPIKHGGMYISREDGSHFELISPAKAKAMAKETPLALEIGKFYVDQVESGITPVVAMSKTLRKYSTKRNHIEDVTVRKYATYWRKRRERDRIRREGMMDAIRKGMDELNNSALDQAKKGLEALNARTDINDDDLLPL